MEQKTKFPIKVRWGNDTEAHSKFLTREIEPLKGTPEDKRDVTMDELDAAARAVTRQKTNVVIENQTELDATLRLLKSFRDGIGHPAYGGKWATRSKHNAVKRVIEEIEEQA